jgi:hypothetical protein
MRATGSGVSSRASPAGPSSGSSPTMSDPRFDPAFQRGYTGPEPELVVREVVSARPQTVPDVAPSVLAQIPVPDDVRPPAETIGDSKPEEIWSPRRNPFALAMLVGGVILIVAGVAMIWSIATQNNSNAQPTLDTGAQALAILNYLLPPALFLGGVLGVLGWLILGALGVTRAQDRSS